MRPGVNTTTRESTPPTQIPTDIGTGFMLAVVESGPSVLTANDVVTNMSDYEAKWAYTKRAYPNAITAYDSAETFFKEGGSRLYVGRSFGPSAVAASVAIVDSIPATCFTAFAKGPGDYGNDFNVVVRTHSEDATIPAGYYRLRVQTDAAVLLEESYDLVDKSAGELWAATVSKYIVLVDGVGVGDPVAGTYVLTGGSLDFGSIVDASWQLGLDRFTSDLGPGIVFAPGRTTSAGQIQIANHVLGKNRAAFLDAVDTATIATLTAMPAALIDSSLRRSRYSGIFGPWLYIPGLTAGTLRKIPPSAAVAGLFARNVGAGLSPNEPAAGERGILNSVLDVTQVYSDTDRQTLNAAGVDVIRNVYGTRKVYGWRTTADPSADPRWINLGNSLLQRAISAEASAVGERFLFRQIDGQNKLLNEFGAALIGEVCMPFYLSGSLFGDTPDAAFKVDVGPSVNTPTTIANNEIHAVISLRMSPFGEEVDIEIVKFLVTESIPA